MTDPAPVPSDPMADPRKLAWFGHIVRERLLRHPAVERIATDEAEIFRVRYFLKRRDCREIVRVINERAAPSTLYDQDPQGVRTSSTHHFGRDDPLTRSCEQYISDLMGIDDSHGETMQGQRYQAGQQFKHHFDFFQPGEAYWLNEAPRGGQRTWTAMIWLNEPREGGETDFPRLGHTFRPETGALLLWNNMTPDGRPNTATLHAGLPVRRGIKHIITRWYRQEPWRLLNPA